MFQFLFVILRHNMTNCSPLPKVTVITVVLNRIESIKSTIEDTLGQTYSNLEYIVIDGGSSDGTLEVIKSFSDRVQEWHQEIGCYLEMQEIIFITTIS